MQVVKLSSILFLFYIVCCLCDNYSYNHCSKTNIAFKPIQRLNCRNFWGAEAITSSYEYRDEFPCVIQVCGNGKYYNKGCIGKMCSSNIEGKNVSAILEKFQKQWKGRIRNATLYFA